MCEQWTQGLSSLDRSERFQGKALPQLILSLRPTGLVTAGQDITCAGQHGCGSMRYVGVGVIMCVCPVYVGGCACVSLGAARVGWV